MATTLARFSDAPTEGATQRYYQHINKFSARSPSPPTWRC